MIGRWPIKYKIQGKTYEVAFEIGYYSYYNNNNHNLAIEMVTWMLHESLYMFTVNISDKSQKNCAFINTLQFPEAPEWIEKNGLGKPTGRYGRGENIQYPEYRFGSDVLTALDKEGYANYLRQYKVRTKRKEQRER